MAKMIWISQFYIFAKMKTGIFWFVPSVIIVIGIFTLSTFLASPVQIQGVESIDKVQHAFAYFMLVSSLFFAFIKINRLTMATSLLIVFGGMIYGFSLELVQYLFFEFRQFEWLDTLANALGCVVGYFSFKLYKFAL